MSSRGVRTGVVTLLLIAAGNVVPGAASADPVIAAAGDIACAPSGAVTSTKCRQKATSDVILRSGASAVLALGDLQYATAKYSSFLGSYDPSWGRVKPITFPAAGNHEYMTSGAAGYFDYFNGPGVFSGRAGDRDKGFYSYDVGTWHLISLNTSDHCSIVSCGKGSAQETWLRQDLAAHPTSCTLAYWHHPRFNSGHDGSASFMSAIFQDLYDANADVVLGGHAHDYERFAPQNPSGKLDRARGIRQFVVGTGGAFFTSIGSRVANSEIRNNSTYGVLLLTLHPNSYDWRFVPEAGKTFTDSGTEQCHGLLPPLPTRSAPAQGTAPQVSVGRLRKVTCTQVGSAGNDVMQGTPGPDVICGLGGNDRILGLGGDDVIAGGDGDDVLSGGPGRDRVQGEVGRDRIRGGSQADELLGNRGRDRLFGGKGNDVLYGNFASDVLHGQSGGDHIVGGGGRNRLYGEAGDDLLIAWLNKRGTDRIVGGNGRDTTEIDRGDRVRSVERRILRKHRR
jgi:Ca2+-binding RTX toxin-like protein